MNVPPYVPQPIEIPNNVAEAPYGVRLGFIRRVTYLHLLSVLVASVAAFAYPGVLGSTGAALTTLAVLVALASIRGLVKGRPMEQRVSAGLLPVLLVSLGCWSNHLIEQGWAMWVLPLVAVSGAAYVALCGRDLSFVAMFFVSLLGSLGLAALCVWVLQLAPLDFYQAGVIAASYAFYYVYDLAALLSRRRLREEWGAVVDLYRDSLNFIGYVPRVWTHWKKHRIWSLR